MPWECHHHTCDRITKGLPGGRTLCWVCKLCDDRQAKKKQNRINPHTHKGDSQDP